MHSLTIDRVMPLPAATLYRAWTTGWETWFAARGSVHMRAVVGAPFHFDVVQTFDDGRATVRHPHYGRFVALEPDAHVALTWVTGPAGTAGVETLVTVRLQEDAAGTNVSLSHEGFATVEARDRHAAAWPLVLDRQKLALRSQGSDDASRATQDGGTILPRNRSIPGAAVVPTRSYPDLDAAVAWLREVLGCRERLRVPGDRVQLTVGSGPTGSGAIVVAAWDAAAAPATGGRPPAILMVRVADVDAAFARALALGATALAPPTDQPFGERQASVRDPAGHAWSLTQTIADVDPADWGGMLVD